MTRVGLVTIVVDEYDPAIAFFVDALGFELVEDAPIGAKRWVVVRPPGAETAILLGERFDTSAEFWLNLQMMHDLEQARRNRRQAA